MTQNNTKKSNLLVLGAGNEAELLIEALNKVNPESRANLYVLSPTSSLPEIELVRQTLDIPDSTPIVCQLYKADLAQHPLHDGVVNLSFGRRIALCMISNLSAFAPETLPLINHSALMPNGPIRETLKIGTFKNVKAPRIKNFNRRHPTKRGK